MRAISMFIFQITRNTSGADAQASNENRQTTEPSKGYTEANITFSISKKNISNITTKDNLTGNTETHSVETAADRREFKKWADSHGVDYGNVMNWYNQQVELMKKNSSFYESTVSAFNAGDPSMAPLAQSIEDKRKRDVDDVKDKDVDIVKNKKGGAD